MLGYLQKKYGRISCELLLSGPGIKNIYDFLRDTKKEDEPQWLREQISGAPDPPALISQIALENKSSICDRTLSIFVSITERRPEIALCISWPQEAFSLAAALLPRLCLR